LGAFLLSRKTFIPEAFSPFAGIETLPAILESFFKSLIETLNLLALKEIPYLTVSILIIAGITVYGIFLGRKGNFKVLLFLFFSLTVCLLPSSLFYRTNLLLPPTLFAMSILSFGLVKIYHHIPRTIKAIGIVAFVFMLGMMARENYLYQENLHPLSLVHVYRKGELLFYREKATIPHVRREKALMELKALGLTENISWDQFQEIIRYNVSNSSHRRPQEGKLFRPIREPFFR